MGLSKGGLWEREAEFASLYWRKDEEGQTMRYSCTFIVIVNRDTKYT